MAEERRPVDFTLDYDFVAPSADYSKADTKITDPLLVEACGIDGRFSGGLRSFPGFRALGLNEAYRDAGGNCYGPLLVGPGINHARYVNGSWQCFWQFLPLAIARHDDQTTRRIKFFKHVAFQKASKSSQIVSGFVIGLPWPGAISQGASSWNSTGSANWGLPVIVNQFVLVFIYWDDEPYPHPCQGASNPLAQWGGPNITQTIAPGWRARLLSAPWYLTPGGGGAQACMAVNVTSFGNTDVASYGNAAYITNPMLNAPIWASPNLYGFGWGGPSALVGAMPNMTVSGDGGHGPQTLYYDSTHKYVAMRPMGSQLSFSLSSAFSSVDALGDWYDNPLGKIRVPSNTNRFALGVTCYSSSRDVRTTMERLEYKAHSAATNPPAYPTAVALAKVKIPVSAWSSGFDYVELWRSPLDLEDSLFLESRVALPSLPAYSATKDGADQNYRQFILLSGSSSKVPSDFLSGSDIANNRLDLIDVGLSDVSLAQQEPYSGYDLFDQAPPDKTSRIVTSQKMTFVVGDSGDDYDAAGFLGPARAVVPPRLRWTSPLFPRPEDFGDTANSWAPDADAGMLYGLATAGNFNFVVGDKALLAARKAVERVSVSTVGDDLVPVSRFAWCVGAGNLFVLTKNGLFVVSGSDASVQPVDALATLLRGHDYWGQELCLDGAGPYPAIGLEYDESGNCLFIRNLNRLTALVLWLETGAVTTLEDFVWEFSTSGRITTSVDITAPTAPNVWPNSHTSIPTSSRRAFFIGEVSGAVQVSSLPIYGENLRFFDVFYADFANDAPPKPTEGYTTSRSCTMHGCARGTTSIEVFAPPSGSTLNTDDWNDRLLSSPILSLTANGTSSEWLEVVGNSERPPGGAASLLLLTSLLNRRMSNCVVHLFSPDRKTHIRRVFMCATVGTDTPDYGGLRYVVAPQLKAEERMVLSGGLFVLAPIVFRAVVAPITSDPNKQASNVGGRVNLSSACAVWDVLDVDRYYRALSGEYGAPLVERAMAGLASPVCFTLGKSKLTAPVTLSSALAGCVPVRDNASGVIQLAQALSIGASWPVGRLREDVRVVSQVGRTEQETAVGLSFSGLRAAVGWEAYLSGVLVELQSARVLGSILASPRKAG